ncbi:MAG: SHOCT domain-containing protein [Petrotogales bacterium]
MMFFGLFLLIALFVLILRPDIFKNIFGDSKRETTDYTSGKSSKSKEILKERYARGDISDDEYRKILRNIEGGE